MGDIKFQACQRVDSTTRGPWWETDEFGVTIYVGEKVDHGSVKLCAMGPTAEAAKAALDRVIDGFCVAPREDCSAVGAGSVGEYKSIWERFVAYMEKFGERLSSSRNPALKL